MNDPRIENSREARIKAQARLNGDKYRIYRALLILQKAHARHIAQFDPELDYHAIQRRVSEMVKSGDIRTCGKKDGYTLYECNVQSTDANNSESSN